jgi:hypothetical protein
MSAQTPHDPQQNSSPEVPKRPGPLSVIQSVVAAAFGVQSEKRLKEDFQQGKPGDYILYGIIFTVIFVVTLIMVVSHVVDSAGQ